MKFSDCNCEFDKPCDIGEYLDYKNCKCRQRIAGSLVEDCNKNIDENEMIYNETLNTITVNDYKKVCGSCTLYIVLFAVLLVTSAIISTGFIYFYSYSKKNITNAYYLMQMITFEGINYFFNVIKDIDPNLLTINKVLHKNTGIIIHEIKYIMMQSINNQNIDKEVPLCLSFSDVDAYIIEESGSKYLIFALTENNKEVLELYKKLWNEIKYHIKTINSGKCNSSEYGNDIM